MTTTTDTTMRRLIFEQQPKRKAKAEGVVLCCRTGGVLELEGDDFVSQLPRCLLRRSVLVVVGEASRRVGVSAVLGIAVVGALLGDAVLLRAFFDVAQGPLVLDLFFLLPVTVVFVVLVAILRHSLLLL